MSTRDTMELKEETIRAQYEAALGMVFGLRSCAAAGEAFGRGGGGGAVAGDRHAADVPVDRAGDGDAVDGAARGGAAGRADRGAGGRAGVARCRRRV